jgi:hypothetical protein
MEKCSIAFAISAVKDFEEIRARYVVQQIPDVGGR